jgi:hypothetical protein
MPNSVNNSRSLEDLSPDEGSRVLRRMLDSLPESQRKGAVPAVLATLRLDWSRRNRPESEVRPILSAIFDAYIQRIEIVLENWSPNPDQVGEIQRVWDELVDLQGWVEPRPEKWEKWTDDHDDSAGNVLVQDYGKSYSEAKRLIRKSKEFRRGRPGTSRMLAVAAMELKIHDPSLRWRDVRDKVCDCSQSKHGDSCLAKLKSAVSELTRMLRRYSINLPSPP